LLAGLFGPPGLNCCVGVNTADFCNPRTAAISLSRSGAALAAEPVTIEYLLWPAALTRTFWHPLAP
jgi:hypothetical protein